MKKEIILVTGSAGFIGFHLSNALLKQGHTIVGVDNLNNYYSPALKRQRNTMLKKNCRYFFYNTNIKNIASLKKIFKEHKIEKVCNLAAEVGVRNSIINPDSYIDTNIHGFHNILRLMIQYKVSKIVYASSSSVYGNTELPKNGFSETQVLDNQISVYGMSKKADELLSNVYNHLYHIETIGLRFFTVYGPWGRPDMSYFKFANLITSGKPIDLYNNGNMLRDFTYIDDIVDGISKALFTPIVNTVINLGNSEPVDLKTFVEKIERLLKIKAKKVLLPLQDGDMLKTYANIERANKLLHWKPKTSIDRGLEQFVNWYTAYTK